MKRMTRKILVIVVLLLLSFGSVNAFRVSPVRLDLEIPRGQTKEITLNLLGSKGVKVENLIVFVTDISMERNGTLKFDRLEGFKHSAVPWFKFEQKEFRLLERQSKELKLKIMVPRTAEPGEYYSVLMCEPTEFTSLRLEDKLAVLKMKSRVAVVFVIDVPGRIYEKKGEAISAKVEEIDGKIKITSSFRNAGNIHLDVSSIAVIQNDDGRTTFGQIKLSSSGRESKEKEFVFPSSVLDFTGILDKPLPMGKYTVDVVFDYGYKFRKTRKKANFSINRETNVDESEIELLSVEPKEIKIELSEGAFRVKPIKIVNVDCRTLRVFVETEDEWLNVTPSELTLKPGEKKVLKAVLSIPRDKKDKRVGEIVFKLDRGKIIKIPVVVMRPGLLALSEKAEEKIKEESKVIEKVEEKKIKEEPKVVEKVEEKKIKEEPKVVEKVKEEKVKKEKSEAIKEEITKSEEKLTEEIQLTSKLQEYYKALNKKLSITCLIIVGLVVVLLIIVLIIIFLRLIARRADKLSKTKKKEF